MGQPSTVKAYTQPQPKIDRDTITQQPHDWSHLDYPTYEDHEALYTLTKETK